LQKFSEKTPCENNKSDDIQFMYKFHSKFTFYANYEHLPVKKEFNVCITLCCYAQIITDTC